MRDFDALSVAYAMCYTRACVCVFVRFFRHRQLGRALFTERYFREKCKSCRDGPRVSPPSPFPLIRDP